MTKDEKRVVIDNLTAKLNEYPHFYLTDIADLNAEQTASLRRKCFESGISLIVQEEDLDKIRECVREQGIEILKIVALERDINANRDRYC